MSLLHGAKLRANDSSTDAALVPRFEQQGYGEDALAARRQWLEQKTGNRFVHIASHSIPSEQMRGKFQRLGVGV